MTHNPNRLSAVVQSGTKTTSFGRNLRKPLVAVGLALAASCFSFSAAAQTTYSLNATDVSEFGSGSFGSVTLTQSSNDVLVSVTLSAGLNFVDTGSHSIFTFNLGGQSSVSDITGITFANGLKDVFAVAAPASNSPFGTFTYGINCVSVDHNRCTEGGSGSGYVDPLTFTVRGATISEFSQLSTGSRTAFFAADVTNLAGNTGVIGATVAAVPEPETYAMLLAGLGLMGFTVRRRTHKQA
jgi:hypothetical protein